MPQTLDRSMLAQMEVYGRRQAPLEPPLNLFGRRPGGGIVDLDPLGEPFAGFIAQQYAHGTDRDGVPVVLYGMDSMSIHRCLD